MLGYFDKAITNLKECVAILEAHEVKSRNEAHIGEDDEADDTILGNNLMGTR